jgi:hypothetical protein
MSLVRGTSDSPCWAGPGSSRMKPRVLIVAPYPTVPDNIGGKVRIVQLARNLAQLGVDVTLQEPFVLGRAFPEERTDGVRHRRIKYPFILPRLFTDFPLPYQFLVSLHPGYGWMSRRYRNQFDVVQFEHASFADLLDDVPCDVPVVYDAHNVEYDYVQSEVSGGWFKKLVARRIGTLEEKLVRRAARIIACTEQDKRRFSQLYGVPEHRVAIIPNGIREISMASRTGSTRMPHLARLSEFKHRILFSGSDVAHNRSAVRFILEVLATLSSECAFLIKGPCGTRFRHNPPANVFIDTGLGSIGPYAALTTVGVNPVTQGSGSNLKLLDYLAHGLPVVTTEFGLRGYEDLRPFVTVCPLEAFRAEVGKDRRVLSPAVAGALQKYLWRNLAASVGDIYKLLAQPGGEPGAV